MAKILKFRISLRCYETAASVDAKNFVGTHVHGSHVALANELTLSFLLIVVFPQKQSKEIGHNLRKSYPLLSLYNAG